jgi:hypothetical protein
MEESSQNENIINNSDEIYLNDVVMERERVEEEYKFSQVCKLKKKCKWGEEIIKENLKKLNLQINK